MAKRKGLSAQIAERIFYALTHDYPVYDEGIQTVFQYSENTQVPKKAVEEIRNAFGHFADGFVVAMRLGLVGRRKRGAKPQNASEALLEVERGRRHIVAAQFWNTVGAIGARRTRVRSLLTPEFVQSAQARKDYRARLRDVEARCKKVHEPSRDMNLSVRQCQAEIKRIKRSRDDLELLLDEFDGLYEEICDTSDGIIKV